MSRAPPQHDRTGSSGAVGSIRMLAGSLGGASEPIERPPLFVNDAEHESEIFAIFVLLERDEIWKPVDCGLANYRRRSPNTWPRRKRLWHLADSPQRHVDCCDELVAESVAALLIPECGSPKLATGFRMKLDPHAVARVPLGSPLAPFPRRRSEPDLPRHRANAVPTPRPRPPQVRRRVLLGWTAALRLRGRARDGAIATPRREGRPRT